MSDEAALASIIIAQSTGTIGVPVLLFTTDTLAADHDDHAAGPVEDLMRRLDLEPGRVDLFGTDAYVLQTALGVQRLPGEL